MHMFKHTYRQFITSKHTHTHIHTLTHIYTHTGLNPSDSEDSLDGYGVSSVDGKRNGSQANDGTSSVEDGAENSREIGAKSVSRLVALDADMNELVKSAEDVKKKAADDDQVCVWYSF